MIAAVTAPAEGREAAGVPTVLSFWPHPREVLHGETRLRLDLPEEKLSLLAPLGIRQLVLVPFNRQLAQLEPRAFVEQVLVGQLGARHVAVGENFRFGAGRRGDTAELQRLGAELGVAVTVVPILRDGEERVSSSRIRRALGSGDLQEARRLLQRPYRFSGAVVHGRGLGRQLGWPTANLQVDGRKFLPLEGVYAARVQIHDEPGHSNGATLGANLGATVGDKDGDRTGDSPWLAAVMNLGPQPTVDPAAPSAVEVHLLDRRLELVGRWLRVEPLALLRRQQRFAGLDALRAQIARDAEQARGLAAGVGMGESPADECGDAAQQQNP